MGAEAIAATSAAAAKNTREMLNPDFIVGPLANGGAF
jgi:hypothetical protein